MTLGTIRACGPDRQLEQRIPPPLQCAQQFGRATVGRSLQKVVIGLQMFIDTCILEGLVAPGGLVLNFWAFNDAVKGPLFYAHVRSCL